MARPRGTYGEISSALLTAAGYGPATVRQLAQRARVGFAAAQYTCSRLVDCGELRVYEATRPMVVGLPPASNANGADLALILGTWTALP